MDEKGQPEKQKSIEESTGSALEEVLDSFQKNKEEAARKEEKEDKTVEHIEPEKKEAPEPSSFISPWAPGKKNGKRSVKKEPDPDMTIPLGVPLAYTLLCGTGIVLLLVGALISNLTVQNELAPDPLFYEDGTEDDQYLLDLKDYRRDFEESRDGLRNARVMFNLGVFSLCLGFVGGAFFAPDLRWELRATLILAAGLIIGLGAFQL